MAKQREVERAKKRLLEETRNQEWVHGVGIGLVEGELGLVVSVRPGTKPAASRLVNKLEFNVPVSIRVVNEIRARVSSKSPET